MIRLLILWVGCTGLLPAQSFTLNTVQAGLTEARQSNGVAVADYDLDGDLDVYFVAVRQYDPNNSATWNRLYRNNGNGTFTDVTEQAGVRSYLSGYPINTMGNKYGASWGDYDNDGDPDLFLTHLGPDMLFQNNGDGTFTEVTQQAGVAGNDTDVNSSALWWDFDLDGDLDLYVGAWIGANRMYENLGGGVFQDISLASGLADSGRTWTSIPIDANNDTLPDLYVVNDFGANHFFVNLGNGAFQEATTAFGLEDEGHGMGVCIGDYNNDGWFDIYLTNIYDLFPNPLFTNTGQSYFIDLAAQMGVDSAGWAWGTEFFDCDHDGDEELYVVNGFLIDPGDNMFFNNMLIETGNPGFVEMSAASGTNGSAEARGLVVFDYDDDGDLDLLVANFNEPPYLYVNQTVTQNWLKVKLEGTTSNRNAFGASIRVTAGGQTYHRHNDGVEFLGQSIQPLHVGLGNATNVDELVVRWPDGTEESFHNIPVNQQITVREGVGIITAIGDTPGTPVATEFR
ncbi:MAG: CRTAC1 family protein, partial [Calditrichaeota bacterium]